MDNQSEQAPGWWHCGGCRLHLSPKNEKVPVHMNGETLIDLCQDCGKDVALMLAGEPDALLRVLSWNGKSPLQIQQERQWAKKEAEAEKKDGDD